MDVVTWNSKLFEIHKYLITTSLAAVGATVTMIGVFGPDSALWYYIRQDTIKLTWYCFMASAGLSFFSVLMGYWAVRKSNIYGFHERIDGVKLSSDIRLLEKLCFSFTVVSSFSIVSGFVLLFSFASMLVNG